MTNMMSIENRHIIDSRNLSGEAYFTSIVQEAYTCGILNDSEIEDIQLQCIKLLAYKCERYNSGDSSSIRVEAAESIMKSNLYTIGLYLKSLPDADCAANELKMPVISEMYQKGRKLINAKLHTARHLYRQIQKNKLETINYTYNATLSDEGVASFFTAYDPDYEAHESPASIDYQLCNPVTDLTGVEFIQKYLESVFLENEFCRNFAAEDIHHLLCGYDEGYKDLLINIFEQVLTAALGCTLANRSAVKLDISEEEIERLNSELPKEDDYSLALKIRKAAGQILEEMNIKSLSLRRYIERSLPKIVSNIVHSVRTNAIGKAFAIPYNPDLEPKIQFISDKKMDDDDYRKFIDELLRCRYSSDKLALIEQRVKSFGDIEDVLFDAQLDKEEITSVFGILGDIEMAAMLKRHPFVPDIRALDLSEAEGTLRLCLKSYIGQLSADRQEQIFKVMKHLADEEDNPT